MNADASRLIARLGLSPLPGEGGFFAPTWTSPGRGPDGRAFASAILFLITQDDFSALHRLGMDEVWQFGAGDAAELFRLDPRDASCRACVLGPDVAGGDAPQAVVPAGEWQGVRILPARARDPRGWSLFTCTVSPAWDRSDFELGRREALVREFPPHAAIIRALTR
ncbi:MAG TPA: cupin domain-containing protein [Opitutaceae bacterium]|nr:cupin domain-containing protein [Opitutaceae bacterium]